MSFKARSTGLRYTGRLKLHQRYGSFHVTQKLCDCIDARTYIPVMEVQDIIGADLVVSGQLTSIAKFISACQPYGLFTIHPVTDRGTRYITVTKWQSWILLFFSIQLAPCQYFVFQYNPWIRALNECNFSEFVRQRFQNEIRKPPKKSELPRVIRIVLEYVGGEFPEAYDANQIIWSTTVTQKF